MKKLLSVIFAVCLALCVSAQQYHNPIIGGYHPDPSIVRVGDDFYLINSSFCCFPGIPISHSKDLIHWEQIGNALTRTSQLNLKGLPSDLGVFAPTIRYHDGTYYIINTNVGGAKVEEGGGLPVRNFFVTAKDPRGPWSEPIWLQQGGIDPSLLFEDGKCYMVSNPDGGIYLCEIDPKTGKQLTPSKLLWKGTGGRYPEGPHLYKKDGYYYLLISEGGTESAHCLTIARSKNPYGPYESNPANPILTNCREAGQLMQIQGTGHGDFVQAKDGSWWVVFLGYRNFGGSYHHLGRETFLAPMTWNKGEWPVINNGNPTDTVMTAKLLPQVPVKETKNVYDFTNGSVKIDADGNFPMEFVRMQNIIPANYILSGKGLTLTGHGTMNDYNQPTFLAIRQCTPKVVAETTIDLSATKADNDNSRFGLSVFQTNQARFDLYTNGKTVNVWCKLKSLNLPLNENVFGIPSGAKKLNLRVTSDGLKYHFYFATDNGAYKEIADQDCALMSTEVAGGFTGVIIGMFAEGGNATFTQFALE